MKTIDAFIRELDEWMAAFGPGRQRAQQKLAEYACLPIRRFSNAHAEKAANYVRIPSSVSLDGLGLWHASVGALRVARGQSGFEQPLGVAAGYFHLSLKTQARVHDKGITTSCTLLRDAAAETWFLLASCESGPAFDEACRTIKRLNDAGMLRDAGSKVALLCMALNDLVCGDPARAMSHFDHPGAGIGDPFGALGVYRQMALAFGPNASRDDQAALLSRALEIHALEAACVSTDEVTADFDAPAWALLPCEVIAYASLMRRRFGVDVPLPESPWGDVCRRFLAGSPIAVQCDDLATAVKARADKVLFD